MAGTDRRPLEPGRAPAPLRLLSVVVPARDEAGGIAATLAALHAELSRAGVPHEIVAVDDGSTDRTWEVLEGLRRSGLPVAPVRSAGPHGFGRAVVRGFDAARGDAVAVVMADGSDDPRDLVAYWRVLQAGFDCAFGSRFIKGGRTVDYPRLKLALNRLANWFIMLLFGIGLNDTTNAFKAYRSTVIAGCRPFLAPHFNLTIEIPLKAIVRGFSYAVVPITWRNRGSGLSKFRIKEMGSRYLFICLYVWLERHFSRGDYRSGPPPAGA
ncbi:MAG: glycosyltransferase family 2 protein [Elusimicrobia bacterium]|nr:glycosyltransferase family 2 protein [Elusimicrobiota bacterium]